MVTAFFVATTVAQAADVNFGGELLTRYEVLERNDFNDTTEADSYFQSRVRLNANVKVNDSTSAFIMLQSNRTWGETFESTAANNSQTDPSGNLNAGSFAANDLDNSVGVHEAYFTLNNFATLPVDLKVGRQEVILDGHRLFGDTLWTMGENSHDAIRLNHKHDNILVSYAYIQGSEESRATDTNDNDDTNVHLAYLNYAGILGGKLSVTYAYLDDGCGRSVSNVCNNQEDDIHTIGFRQAGQLYGIDYRGEYYYQWGDARATAEANIGAGNTGANVDRDAYMFGVRIGKTFNNVAMKPGLTLWYDYLSGTSDEDARNNEFKSFNTLFDTGHKFYGLQDVFLGVGTNSTTGGTDGFGLQDVAVKAKISPMPGWTVKADYHLFFTAEGVAGSNTQSGLAGNNSNDLGSEIDLTVVNAYNANTKIMVGFSNFNSSQTMRNIRTNVGGDDANWFYTQIHVNF